MSYIYKYIINLHKLSMKLKWTFLIDMEDTLNIAQFSDLTIISDYSFSAKQNFSF